MSWVSLIDKKVWKYLDRIPKDDAQRIILALEEFSANPFSGDIRKVDEEKDVWRRRVGSYRIKYEIRKEKKIVHIFKVERRTSNTY